MDDLCKDLSELSVEEIESYRSQIYWRMKCILATTHDHKLMKEQREVVQELADDYQTELEYIEGILKEKIKEESVPWNERTWI